jgi:hypothetical protein
LILKLLNGFSIILNTLIVSQRDNKELIKEIAEGTITLKFVVFFKSLIGSIIVNYFINYLLSVIIELSFYSVYNKFIFLLLFN